MPSNVLSTVKEALSQLAEELKKNFGPVEMFLFGSFAKGDWFEDIDIIVVSETFKGKTMAERVNVVRRLAHDNLAFEILTYTPKNSRKL